MTSSPKRLPKSFPSLFREPLEKALLLEEEDPTIALRSPTSLFRLSLIPKVHPFVLCLHLDRDSNSVSLNESFELATFSLSFETSRRTTPLITEPRGAMANVQGARLRI